LRCIDCGADYAPKDVLYLCSKCKGLLDVVLKYDEVDVEKLHLKPFNTDLQVWKYRELLPIEDYTQVISLGEGGTKLYRCLRIGNVIGLGKLYVKNEGGNPTGSFKDRGMTVGVTRALELGAKATACASTGNTSASLAAYSAKAGLNCIVLIPSGKIAIGKLAQAVAHGAKVIAIKGDFDHALKLIRDLCEKHSIYLLNSINPYRLEGQKTLAYEVFEQLGCRIPDVMVVPVGNAGNISAIWKGFKELKLLGVTDKLPRMIGVQAAGAAPIASMMAKGMKQLEPVEKPETIATAIRIGYPVNWKKAVRAVNESKGAVTVVTDEEIVEAQKAAARLEGLFIEAASAASIAGLKRALQEGIVDKDEVVVCVATGHGLKDPGIIERLYEKPIEVEASLERVLNLIGRVESGQL